MSEQQNPKFHKWFHNFLIYFAFWAFALIAVIQGIREIVFANENNVQAKAIVIILAVLLMLVGAFLIKVRFDLAAFRPQAPKEMLGVCIAAAAILVVMHLFLYMNGDNESPKAFEYAPIVLVWGVVLYRYYNDRPYLFKA